MVARLGSLLLLSLAVALPGAVASSAAQALTAGLPSAEGSGCPPGTVATVLSPDSTSFSLLFDSYVAEVGPGVPEAHGLRECEVEVPLTAPPGWSFALIGVDLRGFVFLQPGVTATLESSVRFNRQEANHKHAPPLERLFIGPASVDYLVSPETPPLQIDWSKCGGTSTLHITTRLELTASTPTGTGLASVDTLDGAMGLLDPSVIRGYRFVWRKCD